MTEKLFDECDNPEWMDKLANKLELIEYANSLRDKIGKIEGDFVWTYTVGARERIDEVVSKFKVV